MRNHKLSRDYCTRPCARAAVSAIDLAIATNELKLSLSRASCNEFFSECLMVWKTVNAIANSCNRFLVGETRAKRSWGVLPTGPLTANLMVRQSRTQLR